MECVNPAGGGDPLQFLFIFWGIRKVEEHHMKFIEAVKGKKVLFITTKNLDYIRNTQEIRILNENAASVDVVSSNVKNYIFRILDVWRKVKKKEVRNNDVVFVGFEPQFVIPFIGFKLGEKVLIIDFFISVYDTLACDRKKIRKDSIFAKYCKYIDRKTISRADYIITDTKTHADFFINEFRGDKERFETLYLEADPSIYYPRMQNKTEKLIDKFVVLYFGSILPLQGVDVVLDAIRELKNEEDIYFDIIGPIPEKYDKPLLNNVRYTEWLSQEELSERIANADLCLAGHFNKEIEKAQRTIPGKAYIYEMMKKKIILGDNNANRELFNEDENHFFVDMSNAAALVSAIMRIKNGKF